jgi:hypothetical protein
MVISYFDVPIDYQFLVQRDSPVFLIFARLCFACLIYRQPIHHQPKISTWGFSYSYEPWFMINRRDPALVSTTIHVPILTVANIAQMTQMTRVRMPHPIPQIKRRIVTRLRVSRVLNRSSIQPGDYVRAVGTCLRRLRPQLHLRLLDLDLSELPLLPGVSSYFYFMHPSL